MPLFDIIYHYNSLLLDYLVLVTNPWPKLQRYPQYPQVIVDTLSFADCKVVIWKTRLWTIVDSMVGESSVPLHIKDPLYRFR